ncbi:hypothetical protein N7468_009364 [Penicillium chermesinum]|uniref:Transcription factor n=1 Tax=Penicillium chermesinum TaxID=63820 RepID=A0A9W9TG29_9EURO|nr:uncharacterized protein N7468_009364 [Penicillium chermesinum]KAJ5220160.1 hypothetical protein N7468_009364 [Penicillium chermesinum]
MSSRTSIDSERVALSQPRHMIQGLSNMASRTHQDDDLSSQDSASLCSSVSTGHGIPQDMKDWNLNPESLEQATSSKDSPQVHMLSFSLSQPLMTPTVGPNDVMYPSMDFPAVSDLQDHNEMPRDFYSFVDISAMDHDASGMQSSTPDDALSVAHSTEDGHFLGHDTWSMMPEAHYPGTTLDQLSSSLFQTVPVSPPLTEASNDISVTSSCSHPGFPSFMAPDESMIGEYTSPLGSHGINPAEPLFPNASPLSDKDPNRTIRPSKPARRGTLSGAQPQVKSEEFFSPLPAREPVRQRSKDGAEARNPREHQYYSLPTHSDGKYYCPFANGDKPCNHPPTTQKCAYHLTVARSPPVWMPSCVSPQMHASSATSVKPMDSTATATTPTFACGKDANALFLDMDSRVDGTFSTTCAVCMTTPPRSATAPPETSPTGPAPKKKDTSGGIRKRRVTGPTPAPAMKRTRSIHSQNGSVKATPNTAQHGQRLRTAEHNYFKCRARLLSELEKITPPGYFDAREGQCQSPGTLHSRSELPPYRGQPGCFPPPQRTFARVNFHRGSVNHGLCKVEESGLQLLRCFIIPSKGRYPLAPLQPYPGLPCVALLLNTGKDVFDQNSPHGQPCF